MENRHFGFVTLLLCSLLLGCQPKDDTGSPPSESSSSHQRPSGPTFSTARFTEFQNALGSSFTLTDDQGVATFVRRTPPNQVQVRAQHDGLGIQNVICSVSGPADQDAILADLCRDSARPIAKALGLAADKTFEDHIGIGMAYVDADTQYSFYYGRTFITLKPAKKLTARVVAASRAAQGKPAADKRKTKKPRPNGPPTNIHQPKPGDIQYQLLIVPVEIEPPSPYRPIPGSSVKQLTALLDGFQLKFNVEDREQLYARDAGTHRELVHCKLDQQGQILWLEAMAYNAPNAAELDKLNHNLWLKLTDLEYQDKNPEAARGFLLGKMPQFAMDATSEVGSACFCLPFCAGGKRVRLDIWGIRPAAGN